MVRAYHAIFCACGFWLPDDPRGSWSEWVRQWELRRFGEATKTNTRHSVAGASHARSDRFAAKSALKYPPVSFAGKQALAIGQGFRRAICESDYDCLACAVLPEHVHMVVARHAHPIERIVGHLKARASLRMRELGIHSLAEFEREDGSIPSPWAEKCWKVFLDSDQDLCRAVLYVEHNPIKEGNPRQAWSFVRGTAPVKTGR